MNTDYPPEWIAIHEAIHNYDLQYVTIGKQRLPIKKASNGCRYVDFSYLSAKGVSSIRFMEQNKNKNSVYAEAARKGQRITWGLRTESPWVFITN